MSTAPNREARDNALSRVSSNADDDWLWAANNAVERCSKMFPDFTTDEVWGLVATYNVSTHEPRAMGPVMLKAVRRGLIEKVGYRTSEDPTCHHRPKAVYRKAVK